MSCTGNGINDQNISTLRNGVHFEHLQISRREQQMKPPQQYQQKHTRGINGLQLKANLATKNIASRSQDFTQDLEKSTQQLSSALTNLSSAMVAVANKVTDTLKR
jgi:glutamate-1-semialdehyde aminotransferase